jgi:hypothetical protein
MVEKIIKNIDKELILTGTPSPYILRGYDIIPVTVEYLLGLGYVSDVRIDLAISTYNFKFEDYDYRTDNINKDKFNKFNYNATSVTLDNVLEKIINKLKDIFKNKPNTLALFNDNIGWYFPLTQMKKTMIMCRSINQAKQVEKYFKTKGINCVSSNSDDDKDSDNIKAFTNDKNILVLIGEKNAKKIEEYIKHKKIKEYEDLKKETAVRKIVTRYFESKGVGLQELKNNAKKRKIIYSRFTKPAKLLLELAGSVEKAEQAIDSVAKWANSRKLDYAIETVFKKWLELDRLKPKEIVKKPFYRGLPMIWSEQKKKWFVIKDGEWLEFADKENTIEWRIIE